MGIEYLDKTHAKLVVNFGSGDRRVRRVKRITYKGKKDAERQYMEFRQSLTEKAEADMSVTELVNWYVDSFEKNGGKQTTVRAYRASAKPIISYFKRFNAKDVSLYDIDSFVTSEAKIRAPKTIRNELSLLKSAYTYAIRRGMLTENPCQYALAPRQVKPQIDILSEDDVSVFCKALESAPIDFRVMCHLALFCGLRKSEIYGLKLSDFSDTITIQRVRHHINGKDIIETPKTASSCRTLYLPKFLIDEINDLIESHNDRIEKSEFLILNAWGEPPASYWCDKHLHQVIKENDLPHVTMHGLRHTYASMLINAGVPIADVSAQLGHASVDITLRIYTHIFKDVSTASERISNLINEKMAPK